MGRSFIRFLYFLSIVGFVTHEVQGSPSERVMETCSGADHTLIDYSALRNMVGQTGATATITSALTAGCFKWSNTDPSGYGDDGGVVIAAANGGYWIRQWSYGPANPVELDWYRVANGDDITRLLERIASTYSPNFYVRVPSTSMTLVVSSLLDFTCNGHAIERFRLLESESAVTIKANLGTMLELGRKLGGCTTQSISGDLVIGSPENKGDRDNYNLTFDGDFTGPTSSSSNSLIRIMYTNKSNRHNAYIRAHVKNALVGGIGFGYFGIETAYIAGKHESAGIHFEGINSLVLEDTLYFSDPYGKYIGWTGNRGEVDYATYGHHGFKVHFLKIGHISGELETAYGGNHWFIANVKNLGSAAKPFTFIRRDQGRLKDGTVLEQAAIKHQWGKSDPFTINTTSGSRYLKFIDGPHKYGAVKRYIASFEATNNGCNGDAWHNDNNVVTLVNLGSDFESNMNGCTNPVGTSRNNTFQGDGVNPAMIEGSTLMMGESGQVYGSQWSNIRIYANRVQYAPNGTTTNCSGNLIEDASLTGSLTVDETCGGTMLRNVSWLGDDRTVMTISGSADITATDLSAPKGSRIEGNGTLILDGKSVSLPYTFAEGGSGGGQLANTAPIATNSSVATAEGQAVDLSLLANDADGDPLTYSVMTHPVSGALTGAAPNLTYTPQDGYSGGDSFTFTASDGLATSSTATVSVTINAAAEEKNGPVVQQIDLDPGWNMVSLHVKPSDTRIESVLSEAGPNLMLAKNGNGDVYFPASDIDDIGAWRSDDAYQLYATAQTTFSVSGEPLSVNSVPIPLEVGWNLVPYLHDASLPVDEALASIKSDLVLVKSGDGDTFYPEMGIDDIGTMTPGDGYQIYVERETTLIYPYEDGPYAHWSFDGSGSIVTDYSGNDYHGTLSGATRSAAGVTGGALAFDGVDDYVDLGAMDIAGSEMTISAWFNADDFENDDARIISKANGRNNADHWWMLSTYDVAGSMRLRFRLKTNGTTHELIGDSGSIAAGEWVHAVARYDGTRMELFVNGTTTGSAPKSGTISTASSVPVYIGNNPAGDGAYKFDGRIDDLRIYDRALTDQEIQALYSVQEGI